MSRGRPRHQASRRRTYSTRQRDVRERQLRSAEFDLRPASGHEPFEREDQGDYEAAGAWQIHLSGRPSAA